MGMHCFGVRRVTWPFRPHGFGHLIPSPLGWAKVLRPLGHGTAGVALLFLSACSSFRTEMGPPVQGRPSEFTNGQTRVETVLRKMGPPDCVTRLPEGFAFLYEHSIVSEFQLGISVNYSFLRYFKFIHAWNRLDEEAVLLTFDDDGILRTASSSEWREDLGGGTAAQFLVSVMSLSDISKILRPADAHRWGEELLQPAPVALNSAQSLRSGAHGLQQRISPDYVGQQTLEMTKPKTEKEKKRIKRNYQQPPATAW
jgi:hypothetical protein